MEHQQAAAHHDEHPSTTIRQYILIGVILAIITAIELALTEAMDLPFRTLVVSLILLSALKFGIVVALFMHLKFDHPLLTKLFMFGLVLASALLVALLALFGTDNNVVARDFTPFVAAAHGDDDHDEATPVGDPAAGVVAGLPVGEYYQANCAVCHGADRAGVTGLGLPLTPAAMTQPDAFYADTIANGRAGTAMPPWSGSLTAEDINALVQYFKHVEP